MSKTVTIPSGDNPFIAKINDRYYSYPAGTTVSVPDEVAALIESIQGNDPPATIPAAPDMPRGGKANDVLMRTAAGAEWKTPNWLTPSDAYTLPAATEEALGGVKMAAYVEDVASDANAAAVRTGLIALIEALKEAGIVSDTEPEEESSGT